MAEKEKLSLHKWQDIMGIENMKELSLSLSLTHVHRHTCREIERTNKQVDQDGSL